MKKFLFLPFVLALLIASGCYWFYKNSGAVSKTVKYDYFVVEKGTSASEVGTNLEKKGLIKSALAFKIYLQFTGQASNLQTGEFRLTPSYSLFQTVNALFSGPVQLWVTIPEGLRREEIAKKFAVALDKDGSFVTDFLEASKGKEGYLFPETYLFSREASASAIVQKMTDTFDTKTKGLKNNSGYTFKEALVMASLIERETKTVEERPIVAGILINRLKADWPLQIDASVQYAVSSSKCKITNDKCDWWPILTLNDLAMDSSYNTYKNTGFPPSPISNPGLSSIKAALSPEESSYWYYIHGTDGKIHYATTLAEHNLNIAKYLSR